MKKLLNVIFFEKTENTKIQFIRYFFVGGISAIVNIGLLYIFKDIFGIHYLISNAIGFIMGLITNYFLSKLLVFTKENMDNHIFEFIIYALIGIIGLGLDTIFMWLFTTKCNIYYLTSKIFSTILVFIWNFGARKISYKIKRNGA